MSVLFDVNFLVALAWPNHIHHGAALRWFEAHHAAGWATCPLTQSGFVRVSANRQVVPDARTPQEAIALLRRLTDLDGHRFWDDTVALAGSDYVDPGRIVGHRQVTDAHLLAVALTHGGKLVTFDAGIRDVCPDEVSAESLVLLPVETR